MFYKKGVQCFENIFAAATSFSTTPGRISLFSVAFVQTAFFYASSHVNSLFLAIEAFWCTLVERLVVPDGGTITLSLSGIRGNERCCSNTNPQFKLAGSIQGNVNLCGSYSPLRMISTPEFSIVI
jgi:hypothetical protein